MENSTTYKERIARLSPSSPVLKNCFFAFIGGGSICLLGEAIARFFFRYFTPSDSYTLVTVAFIFAGALLTGLGVFDSIARLLGAGTLLPVTGFANSVVCSAIDTKSEGLILGVGANIFKIAGPVILYATLSGFLYGVIYFIFTIL